MIRNVTSVVGGNAGGERLGDRIAAPTPLAPARSSPRSRWATRARSSPPPRRPGRRSRPGRLCRRRCAAARSPTSAGWSRPTPSRSPGWSPREIGKPYAEALGEVREIVDTCDFFLGEGRRLYGQTVPSEMPDKQLFTFRNPVGVVGDHHRRQLPGRRAVLVHRPGAAVRQHRGVEAGRVLRRAAARRCSTCSCTAAGCPTAC